MHSTPDVTHADELPPIPVPPPGGPHLLPPTPPPRETPSLVPSDLGMPLHALPSPNLGLPQGFLTPRSYASFSPPSVHTPSAHDSDLMNELREVAVSPTPIHEILRDPAILTSLLSHRKKPRRASSSSHTPTTRGVATPSEAPSDRDARSSRPRDTSRESERERERERDRDRDRDRDRERYHERERDRDRDTASIASTVTVKPRKKERERDRDTDSASILTQVLAEEERQARHLKAVLRQTGARLEEELRRADLAEARARTAEIGVQDLTGKLAASEAGRHQAEMDAMRAQEECRRWQMQADQAEREARRLQTELARSERARAEAEQGEREAKDAARRADLTLREWQAREAGREEVRRLEMRRRYSSEHDEGFEQGRAEGYEAGRQDGYEEGRDEGYEKGRSEGFNSGRLTGFEEGKKASYAEGHDAGYAQGRKEERAKALQAFDRFIESEMPPPREGSVTEYEEDDRTRRWVEATRKMREREPSPRPPAYPQSQAQVPAQLLPPQPQLHPNSPPPRGMPEPAPPMPMAQLYTQPPPPRPQSVQSQHIQAPQPVQASREPSPAPKLVWLHRPLNHHREPSLEAGRTLPMIPEQRA